MSILCTSIFNSIQLLFFTLTTQAHSNTVHQHKLERESLRDLEVVGDLPNLEGERDLARVRELGTTR